MIAIFRLFIAIWICACVLIMLIIHVRWGHPCSAPVAIRLGYETHLQRIDDYRTGISLIQPINPASIIRPISTLPNSSSFVPDNARLISISSDSRWQLFTTREYAYDYNMIHYLYDNLTGRRYDFLNMQSAVFSEDNRCLMVKSTFSQPALSSTITIYDLKTMQALYIQKGDPSYYESAWYQQG